MAAAAGALISWKIIAACTTGKRPTQRKISRLVRRFYMVASMPRNAAMELEE
jgi:hypothetical protein